MTVASSPSSHVGAWASSLWRNHSLLRTAVTLAFAIPGLLLVIGLPLQFVLLGAIGCGVASLFATNRSAQRVLFQTAFALAVVLIGRVLIGNLTSEVESRGFEPLPFLDLNGTIPFIHFKMAFLSSRAGFALAETSFGREYTPNNSYGEAYLAGLLNTVRVAIVGIALASIVGLVVGVARLSNNWLVSKLATIYVETFRNVPLLVQLIFWYTAVILQLPKIDDDASFLNIILISNRSIALPSITTGDGAGLWFLLALGAGAIAAGVWYVRNRTQDATGRPTYPWLSATAVFMLFAIVAYFVTGAPLGIERPELVDRSYVGGLEISPEFAALLIGLVIYTGAFIAEVVRGSIQSISKGQTEAASALGLNGLQRLGLVILPQALRIGVPPLTNQYLNLTKNSSLAVAVAFPDLFKVTTITINQSGQVVPMIVLVMVTYLSLSLFISLIMNIVNSRLRTPER